jgi:YQGE family putative transporter
MMRHMLSRERDRLRGLSKSAQSLLISFIAFGMASPLVTLFSNAFIWRQNHDLVSIALYNGAWMAGVSAGFVINGYLLSRVRLSWMYATGLVIQSASCLFLFELETIRLKEALILGLVSGFAAGVYWANRNLLSLQATKGSFRDYFCGLESALGTFLSVLSPLLFGWFLEIGTHAGAWDVLERYRILAVITLVIQLVGAWYIVRARFEDYAPCGIFVTKASSLWNRARVFTAVKGVAEGSAMFIPTLIVLRLVGQEGAVGVTQSLAMIFTSVVLYVIAARMAVASRRRVLQIGVWVMGIGAVALSCMYSPTGALTYLFSQTLAVQLLWVAANPIILDAINADQDNPTDHYRYIVDRELCLNLGRLLGVGVVLALSVLSDSDFTLRIAPLMLAVVTSSLLVVSRGLVDTH